jgi:putative Holliday junction resolvase
MPQILAVDYGTERVGLAVSDADGRFALPLETLQLPVRARAAAVARLAQERDVRVIVIGRPVRTAGEDSALWPEIKKLGRSLHRRGFHIVYEDEAFSTAEAEALLSETDTRRRAPRGPADALAAKVILEQYLKRKDDDT